LFPPARARLSFALALVSCPAQSALAEVALWPTSSSSSSHRFCLELLPRPLSCFIFPLFEFLPLTRPHGGGVVEESCYFTPFSPVFFSFSSRAEREEGRDGESECEREGETERESARARASERASERERERESLDGGSVLCLGKQRLDYVRVLRAERGVRERETTG